MAGIQQHACDDHRDYKKRQANLRDLSPEISFPPVFNGKEIPVCRILAAERFSVIQRGDEALQRAFMHPFQKGPAFDFDIFLSCDPRAVDVDPPLFFDLKKAPFHESCKKVQYGCVGPVFSP